MSLSECKKNTTFRGAPLSLCMNRTRWDQVLEFYNATGARMVFGLSYFTDTATGEWGSSNVEALLEYTAGRGVVPVAFELGEEMNPSPTSPRSSDSGHSGSSDSRQSGITPGTGFGVPPLPPLYFAV